MKLPQNEITEEIQPHRLFRYQVCKREWTKTSNNDRNIKINGTSNCENSLHCWVAFTCQKINQLASASQYSSTILPSKTRGKIQKTQRFLFGAWKSLTLTKLTRKWKRGAWILLVGAKGIDNRKSSNFVGLLIQYNTTQ